MTDPGSAPVPEEIRLKRRSRVLEVRFPAGEVYQLGFEYLRVYTPSAERRGHGGGEGRLELGKEQVGITEVVPVGHYAVCLKFDDGHDSGLYSWKYLRELGRDFEARWSRYLERCAELSYERKPPEPPTR
ncbi:MAG: gamma-butyrobetaine hydroxylase-like domain-containing protein [Steroidobacteraceae bacterium]